MTAARFFSRRRLLVPLLLVSFAGCGDTTDAGIANAEAAGGQSESLIVVKSPAAPGDSADPRYREAVIASAREMNERGEATARAAYDAIDGGPSSMAAQELGGIDSALVWVGRFERFHDHRQLGQCVQGYWSSHPGQVIEIVDNLVAEGQANRVTASAERYAPSEFAALQAQTTVRTDAAVVGMALAAMTARAGSMEESDPERVGIVAMLMMSLGTKGECVPTQRLSDFVNESP